MTTPMNYFASNPGGHRLENGDRLSQPAFHRLREARGNQEGYDLIGGTVFRRSQPSELHETFIDLLHSVLARYRQSNKKVTFERRITTILSPRSEVRPDLLLRLRPDHGGMSHYGDAQELVGPPELVVEIAHSTLAIDMNAKREDYLAAGVQEYLILCIEEQEIHGWHFPSRRKLKPSKDGIWKSRVFPGLWIDGPALLRRDSPQLVATLNKGLATSEHIDFAQLLQDRLAQEGE